MEKIEELSKELGIIVSLNQTCKILAMEPGIDKNILLEIQKKLIGKINKKLEEINSELNH